MSERTLCVPITRDDEVAAGFEGAERVAIAVVRDGAVERWRPLIVDWDLLQDTGMPGSHEARMVRFLQEHAVGEVCVPSVAEPTASALRKAGIVVRTGAAGDARAAVLAV